MYKEEKTFGVCETARILGLTERKLKKIIKELKYPAPRKQDFSMYFRQADLHALKTLAASPEALALFERDYPRKCPEGYLTTSELSDESGVSESFIKQLERNGKLQAQVTYKAGSVMARGWSKDQIEVVRAFRVEVAHTKPKSFHSYWETVKGLKRCEKILLSLLNHQNGVVISDHDELLAMTKRLHQIIERTNSRIDYDSLWKADRQNMSL